MMKVPSQGTAQLRVVTFNLLCTALGIGVLAIPHVFAAVGVLGGMLLLVIVPLLAERTSAYIGLSSRLTKQDLLNGIMAATFGKSAGWAAEAVLYSYSFGALLGQLVVLKQLLPEILNFFGWPEPPTLLLLAALAALVLTPLSSLPTMEKLKFTSIASVCLQAIIATTIVIAGISAAAPSNGTVASEMPFLVLAPVAWMRGVPVVAFAYQFHQNIPFLLREVRYMETPVTPSRYPSKVSKMQAGVRVALGTCAVLYMAVALASAAAFGADVRANLLVSLSSPCGLSLLSPWVVAAVQAAMGLVMIFVFPVNSFGLRVGLHAALFPGQVETPTHRWCAAAAISATCFAVAAVVDDLGTLFALIGATTGTLIMFIMPSAIALRLRCHSGAPDGHDDTRLARARAVDVTGTLVMPVLTLVFGLSVGISGIVAVLL